MAAEGHCSTSNGTEKKVPEKEAVFSSEWIRLSLVTLGIVIVAVRFTFLWTQCGSCIGGNSWWFAVRALLLLGTEVCLLGTAVLLAYVVPPLIIMWTIVLVFEYIFRHLIQRVVRSVKKDEAESTRLGVASKRKLTRRGSEIAQEVSRLHGGRAVMILLGFIGLIILRKYAGTL